MFPDGDAVGWFLALALGAAPARARPAAVLVDPGVDSARLEAALDTLGVARFERIVGAEVWRRIAVVDVSGRSSDERCGGPVGLVRWNEQVAAGRSRVQLLDLDGALASFAESDLEAACLDEVPAPTDLFLFHLSAAEAQLLAAERIRETDPERAAFHEAEADRALLLAASAGEDLAAPPDLSPEAWDRLSDARAWLARTPGTRVLVDGPLLLARGAESWWDGRAVGRDPFTALDGDHLAQVVRDGTIVAAGVVRVEPGRSILVWANLPGRASYPDRVAAARTAPPDDPPAALMPMLRLLSDPEPALVVTGTDGPLRVWGADGARVRLRLTDRPGTAKSATGAGGGRGAETRDAAFSIGLAGGEARFGGTDSILAGFGIAARFGIAEPVVATIGIGGWGGPLPADEGEDWPQRGVLPVRAGARFRTRDGAFDAGPEGGIVVPLHLDQDAVLPLGAVAASVAVAPAAPVGMRVEVLAGWTPAGWIGGAAAMVEIR